MPEINGAKTQWHAAPGYERLPFREEPTTHRTGGERSTWVLRCHVDSLGEVQIQQGMKGILSTWFIQQNCWIGWNDKNTRNFCWPELNYGIQEEQRRFNLIGRIKKYSINRLKYKHTANSCIMRPKTKHAIQVRISKLSFKNVSFGI